MFFQEGIVLQTLEPPCFLNSSEVRFGKVQRIDDRCLYAYFLDDDFEALNYLLNATAA